MLAAAMKRSAVSVRKGVRCALGERRSFRKAEMLHEFITENRAELIARCRSKIATRAAPRPTDQELEQGVPLFLDQLTETLRSPLSPSAAIEDSAAKHGRVLLNSGFTVAQVVHDYGGICQSITELAGEMAAAITPNEFKTLNLCLDNAIAGAVTEYGRVRQDEGTERLGRLAHELRNQLNNAILSFDALKNGSVGIGGSTGGVLARSLTGLRNLIDRELAEVRLGAGVHRREIILVREFIDEVEVAAVMQAKVRSLTFSVAPGDKDVAVHADRETLGSVVGNLLQNAFKFSLSGGDVALRVHATATRVFIEVEDSCGGLPPGRLGELFLPFEQRGGDRSGVGLGLAISQRGARVNDGVIRVVDKPGKGCVFTLELPRRSPK